MAKKIKMPLILNGAACRSIGDLQANWDTEEVYNFFVDGKLLTWCQDRRYIQADKVAALSKDDSDVRKKICEIFEVAYIPTETFEDNSDWEPKDSDEQEKFDNLKRITDDKNILKNFRQAAFDRDELIDLLDEDISEIYLCHNTFEDFPIADENKTYIGVGNAVAVIPSKKVVDFDARNIKFVNVKFDDAYQKLLGQNPPKFFTSTPPIVPPISKPDKNQAEEFFKLAVDAYDRENYSKAAEYYQKAADLGYVGAAKSLGLMYLLEKGLPRDERKIFQLISKDAEAGDLEAIVILADCYVDGTGTEQDYYKAFELLKKPVEAGDPHAMINMAWLYRFGKGVAEDKYKAFELYKKAANLGDSDAMNYLGVMYYRGDGTNQNFYKAVEWYRRAADAGNAPAMNNLAGCYQDGEGINQDFYKAFELYKKAADLGYAPAMNGLGLCYLHGEGTLQEVYKAVSWMEKAAELGDIQAMNNLGYIYRVGDEVAEDKKVAFRWYLKAAEAGDAEAMNIIGVMYGNGENVRKDIFKAIEWYKKAAELGNTTAMKNLGYIYRNCEEVAEDKKVAFKWYLKAAEAGDAEAMNSVGFMQDNGEGVPQDESNAFQWYKKAADLGDTSAMCNLAYHYQNKIGDYTAAENWYKKAVELGNVSALNYLGNFYENTVGNYPNALHCYFEAAEKGDADAMYNLGCMYHEERGVKKDDKIAVEWLKKAEAKGHAEAAELRKEIEDKCFITTAVCGSFNKPDDCLELTTFRNFRDNWLALQSDGKNLIEEYYIIAPQIVANINKLGNAKDIYKNIWSEWLSPCLDFIKKGDFAACKDKYVEMVRCLKKIYF